MSWWRMWSRARNIAAEEMGQNAKKIAEEQGCYKIMLLTGAKDRPTLQFYGNAGYDSSDKTAFVQWLE